MRNIEIKELLHNSIINNKLLHSYMFIGSKFTEKDNLAMEFAKEILCLNDDIPCNTCKSCAEMDNHNHPDFCEIKLEEGQNSIKIEQIRKMQEDVIKKPIVSEHKVCIIKNSDCMTTGAQNCLLKTLEEPPTYMTIILIVENENLILNTIKSRCTKILFTEERQDELNDEEKERYRELERYFSNIGNYSLLDVLGKIDVLYKGEKYIFELLEYINHILFENVEENIRYIEYVEETKQRLKANANYNMSIDNLIMKIWNK